MLKEVKNLAIDGDRPASFLVIRPVNKAFSEIASEHLALKNRDLVPVESTSSDFPGNVILPFNRRIGND